MLKRREEEMAGNKRGVVDWTEAPDPTMRHNGAPAMVLHMKGGTENGGNAEAKAGGRRWERCASRCT